MPESPEQLRARLRAEIAAIEADGSARSCEVPDDSPDDTDLRLSSASFALACEGDASERAFRKIERLCLVREQASEQLRQRLVRDGFEHDAIEAAIARALACGLVDDRRFADVLVRSRLSQGRGRRGIASELERLGIDSDAVDTLVDMDDDASEVDRALALLDRKPPRSKNRRDGAYRRLAQKGFSASVSSTAARLWCEANPD